MPCPLPAPAVELMYLESRLDNPLLPPYGLMRLEDSEEDSPPPAPLDAPNDEGSKPLLDTGAVLISVPSQVNAKTQFL